jgi:glycosyltransferase involved in cell wall biosynthesis
MMREPFEPAGPPRVPGFGESRAFQVLRYATRLAPRLSIVIPNCDTARYVTAAARAALAQTVHDVEVIVVDDGSHDDSVARLLAIDDPRLTIVHQQNRGLAGARNTGILLARAPFIGFCDSDDVWHPLKAERHLLLMEAAPDIGVSFSFSAYLDEAGRPTGQILGSRCSQPGWRELVRRNHTGNGSTAVVRRACLEQAGLFDESLRNVEEWELWVRIAVHSPLRITRIPEPLTGYRIRTGSLSVDYDSFLRNAWIAIQRFRQYVPDFPERMAQCAYAEVLRIASRKSFAGGAFVQSRRFLLEALQRSPQLFVTDLRALVMLLVHLASLALPDAARGLPYHAVESVLRRLHRTAFEPAFFDALRFAGGLR